MRRGSPGFAGVETAVAAIMLAVSAGPSSAAPPGVTAGAASTDFHDYGSAARTAGAEAFRTHCSACHASGAGRAPPLTVLGLLPARSIFDALSSGAMRAQGASLTAEEKTAVAEYVSGKKMAAVEANPAPKCRGAAAAFDINEPPPFPAWGITATNARAIPAAVGGLDSRNVGGLKLAWAFGFQGAQRARSQPALAGGSLIVGDQNGDVWSLDRRSGCVRWRYQAAAEVRTGIVVSNWRRGDRSARPLAYFGDLVGNVYALDARTGALAWRARPEAHPSTTLTAAPTLFEGVLYVPVSSLEEAIIEPTYACCTFRGSVVAYEARTGRRLWKTYMGPQPEPQGPNAKGAMRYGPSGAPIWNTPSIDAKRRQLFVGTGDNYSDPATGTSDAIVALDLATGRINWTYQTRPKDTWNVACQTPDKTLCPADKGPDFDLGAATIFAPGSDGRDYVLAGSKSGDVYAVDAATGQLRWNNKVGRGGVWAGVYFGMAVAGDRVFVPISDADDHQPHSEPGRPGLYALDLKTGDYIWKSPDPNVTCKGRPLCDPGIAAAITTTADLVLAGGSDGYLRAYDVRDGRVLWSFDTTRPFTTVGGGQAAGGSMNGGVAPIAYHGMLIMPSGYGFAGKMPGNVLLAFTAPRGAHAKTGASGSGRR